MKARGILLGTAAFGAAVLLERQLGSAFADMRRYDRMRAMSGDSSLLVEALKQARDFVVRRPGGAAPTDGAPAASPKKNDGGSLLGTLASDALRYAAIRSM